MAVRARYQASTESFLRPQPQYPTWNVVCAAMLTCKTSHCCTACTWTWTRLRMVCMVRMVSKAGGDVTKCHPRNHLWGGAASNRLAGIPGSRCIPPPHLCAQEEIRGIGRVRVCACRVCALVVCTPTTTQGCCMCAGAMLRECASRARPRAAEREARGWLHVQQAPTLMMCAAPRPPLRTCAGTPTQQMP